ncbi:MAG: hypothetical protein AAF206_31130, partial [Bacteroidota bacterium]
MKKILSCLLSMTLLLSSLYAQFTQIGQTIDGNGPNDNFGFSVAIDDGGQRMVVGAPLFDADFGQVRVYQESGGTWTQIGNDIEGTEIANQFGHSVSINAAGNRIAIGGIAGSDTQHAGQARVYELDNGQWVLMGSPILGETSGDQFGTSVALSGSGDRLAVGAPKNSNDAGRIRVFEWQNNDWVPLGADIDGASDNDQFGKSVSISRDGNVVASGDFNNPGASNGGGQVRVFEWQNNMWVQRGMDIEGQASNGFLGLSVDLSDDGNRLVTSASGDNHGNGIGTVLVYEFANNVWTQMGSEIQGSSNSEAFGEIVSISGDGTRIAVGTESADDVAISSGRVNIYEWTNGEWTEMTPAILGSASFDNLGNSLSFNQSGNRLAIGGNLAGGTAGLTKVYEDSQMPVSVDAELADQGIQLYVSEGKLVLESETDEPNYQVG